MPAGPTRVKAPWRSPTSRCRGSEKADIGKVHYPGQRPRRPGRSWSPCCTKPASFSSRSRWWGTVQSSWWKRRVGAAVRRREQDQPIAARGRPSGTALWRQRPDPEAERGRHREGRSNSGRWRRRRGWSTHDSRPWRHQEGHRGREKDIARNQKLHRTRGSPWPVPGPRVQHLDSWSMSRYHGQGLIRWFEASLWPFQAPPPIHWMAMPNHQWNSLWISRYVPRRTRPHHSAQLVLECGSGRNRYTKGLWPLWNAEGRQGRGKAEASHPLCYMAEAGPQWDQDAGKRSRSRA